jgi:FkbM family methyltransferase
MRGRRRIAPSADSAVLCCAAMKILRRLRRLFLPDPNRFLRTARGVVHIGANVGQERALYDRYGLDVLWVEPIPDVFAVLAANIAAFPKQRALQCLVTDRDDAPYEFNIANNGGESSSILPLEQHRDVWPKVHFTTSITLRSSTLATLLARERIDVARYDALVMDTQGSELLVLKGADALLERFRFIKTEVPDFEAYTGCAKLDDIARFLEERGYAQISRHRFATRAGGGNYYDVVYGKQLNSGGRR